MKLYSHKTILENGTVFTFVTDGKRRWLFSSKIWSQVEKKEVFEFCDKLGADFDCFYDSESSERLQAEKVKKSDYALCLKNLATADDIFSDLDDEEWWQIVEVERPERIHYCQYAFKG